MKTLITFLFMTFVILAHSQDTIYNKNGTLVPAKILEITSTEITYKKSNNLDGPIYRVNKSDVSFIEYSNGTKDVFSDAPATTKTNNDDVYQGQQQQSSTNVVIAPSIGLGYRSFWGWRYRGYYRPWGGYYNYNTWRGGYHGGYHYGHHYGHH